MRRTAQISTILVLCVVVNGCSNVPSSGDRTSESPAPQRQSETAPPEIAQQPAGTPDLAPSQPDGPLQHGGRREHLTCFAGTKDRHARIGVELVDDQVTYFAYYSRWRPRTCSIEAGRGDAYSRWTDNGAYSRVTLADRDGELRIVQEGDAYRFAFFNIDRVRYCGMEGKINGSLTVRRGEDSCVVEGVMDGHAP
jgi:hypothetical protein